jgi:hypothetical protein
MADLTRAIDVFVNPAASEPERKRAVAGITSGSVPYRLISILFVRCFGLFFLCADVREGKLQIKGLVTAMGDYLTSKQDETRGRGRIFPHPIPPPSPLTSVGAKPVLVACFG